MNAVAEQRTVESISKEISSWLREKQARFYSELKKLGEIIGKGYTRYEYDDQGKLVRKRPCSAHEGANFTGADLCWFASAAVAQAISIKYPQEDILIRPVSLALMDTDIWGDDISGFVQGILATDANDGTTYINYHWVLELFFSDRSGIVIDPTPAQIRQAILQDRMLIFPLKNMPKVYTSLTFYEKNYKSPNEMIDNVYEGIRLKKFPGLTIEDYERLVDSLL